MKKLLLFLPLVLLLAACTEVLFETPQPPESPALNKVPGAFHGRYSFVIMNEESVLEIGENYMNTDNKKAYLSDSLVMKMLDDKLVVSTRENKEGPKAGKWSVYVLEDKGCGFVKATTFVINSETYPDVFKAEYDATQIGEGQEKTLIVKTSGRQFNEILANDSVTISVILERLQ